MAAPLVLAAVLLLACPGAESPGLSQSGLPTNPGPQRYGALVEMYRRGDAPGAVAELMRWEAGAIRAARLTPEALSAADGGVLRAIAVLHLDAVMSGAPHAVHFDAGLAAFLELRRRGTDLDFLRRWYVAAVSVMMSRGVTPAGRDVWPQAAQPDADVLLLDGSRLEALATTISIIDEYDAAWHRTEGGLEAAERKYRQALSLAPSLLEARLRLGRVLTLTNRLEEARVDLEIVRRDAPGGYLRYLGNLFLGDLEERAGRIADASECYEAAIREYPDCQTASLALGHLQEAGGEREKGAATVRDLFRWEGHDRSNPQRDPWWLYWYAQYWQIDSRLADLRAMVRR